MVPSLFGSLKFYCIYTVLGARLGHMHSMALEWMFLNETFSTEKCNSSNQEGIFSIDINLH